MGVSSTTGHPVSLTFSMAPVFLFCYSTKSLFSEKIIFSRQVFAGVLPVFASANLLPADLSTDRRAVITHLSGALNQNSTGFNPVPLARTGPSDSAQHQPLIRRSDVSSRPLFGVVHLLLNSRDGQVVYIPAPRLRHTYNWCLAFCGNAASAPVVHPLEA